MFAVILRDMRTRFFNHGLGFLIVPLWPLVHMAVLLGVYQVTGRSVPFGTGPYLFFATGLIPTISFMYVSRMMAYSLMMNYSMTAFPVVRPGDIMLGRAVLEIVGAILMTALTLVILYALGEDPVPYNILDAFAAFSVTLIMAIGVGFVVGAFAMINPMLLTGYSLFTIVIYLSSGTIFIVSNLPAPLVRILEWNPVVHSVIWMRVSYFPSYPAQILSKEYVIGWAMGSLLIGMGMERLMRRRVLDG